MKNLPFFNPYYKKKRRKKIRLSVSDTVAGD